MTYHLARTSLSSFLLFYWVFPVTQCKLCKNMYPCEDHVTYQFHVLPTDEAIEEGEEATFLWLKFHTTIGECSHQLETETESDA